MLCLTAILSDIESFVASELIHSNFTLEYWDLNNKNWKCIDTRVMTDFNNACSMHLAYQCQTLFIKVIEEGKNDDEQSSKTSREEGFTHEGKSVDYVYSDIHGRVERSGVYYT